MLKSDLCDFSYAFIIVKGTITLRKTNGQGFIDIRNMFLAFKNNAPFTNYISKINNVLIDNAEDLNVVMPMYNLLEYSKNCKKTTGSLWNYYRANTKAVLQEKHQMQIRKMVKTLSKKIQRLRKILKLLFH